MKFNNFTAVAMLFMAVPAVTLAADAGCGTLVGTNDTNDTNAVSVPAASGSASAPQAESPAGFKVRNGEAVDFVSGKKTVHGSLQVFSDGGAYRAYWQPSNSADLYALANAGSNTVRLISTPPQGVSVKTGEPGLALAPQRVVSCPAM